MMLVPAKDYSSYVTDHSAQVYSPPAIPEPSAPEYYPPKKYSSSSLQKEDYELPELESELESYVHIELSDFVANYPPNASPPAYPCPQYTPYQHHKYQELSIEAPLTDKNSHAIHQSFGEMLTKIFKHIIYYAIEGVNSSDYIPSFLAIWSPVAIESTLSRRDRYLRECRGNQFEATERCIERNHSVMRRFKIGGMETIPYLGAASSHSLNLWHQLREITLIAAIHGHDVHQEEVQAKIFSCLIGGNLFKIAGISTDFVIREIAKSMILKLVIKESVSGAIPLNVIFNFFTNDAAKVSGHAKKVFAGRYSLPVSGFN